MIGRHESAVEELISAYQTRSNGDAQRIGEALAVAGGFKLMADTIDRVEQTLDDVCAAAWISRRWAGTPFPNGGCWA